MRTIPAAAAAALLTLLPLGAVAADDAAPSDEIRPGACQSWDQGAAARENGWTLKELREPERRAVITYYDQRVAPRANPSSDDVVVATNPDSPVLRVIIVRGDCVVDIGQMGPDLLERILRSAGTPI
jgi:hypothetical protein